MSIQQLDLFHGAVLARITRNKENRISLVEWNEKENRSHYKIETQRSSDLSMLIKYDATARESKKDETLYWDFNNLTYQENCCFCFVCIKGKIISSKTVMEICAIPPEKVLELFTQEEIDENKNISCVVKLEKAKSFRVNRKHKKINLIIKRNEIDNV